MNIVLKRLLDRSVELNERAAGVAVNGFDWMFRRANLVKSGSTWFEYVQKGELMSVRHYDLRTDGEIELADGSRMPIEQELHEIPLLLVPPLGVITDTFDLMPARSLVRYMAARGYKVYMIDWGTPSKKHARLRLADYADRMMNEAIEAVREHSGVRQVSLMGWCMGGLLSLMQAGLSRDARIANIITVASPIDHRGGGVIGGVGQLVNTPVKLMRKVTALRLHDIDPERMYVPGWMTTLMFKLTDPIGSVTTYWDLLMRLWDREFVESHTTTSDYLNNMLSYPAGVVQDMLVGMSVDNKLAKGEIPLGSKVSRLANITAPLYAFAGATDVLVSVPTARTIIDLVNSTDKRFEVAPGGHMGVILGAKAQAAVWMHSADWLAKRSTLKVAPRRPKAAANAPTKTVAAAKPTPRKAAVKTAAKPAAVKAPVEKKPLSKKPVATPKAVAPKRAARPRKVAVAAASEQV